VSALQEPFVLQIGDVFMDGGEGTETESTGDLFVRRRVAVLLREAGEEIDDFFLSPRDSHAEIVANKKRIAITLSILLYRGLLWSFEKEAIPILKWSHAKNFTLLLSPYLKSTKVVRRCRRLQDGRFRR
jgi:hypothetical protein